MSDFGTGAISVIIPTRNAGVEFERTLAAIREQTREAEVVVVDSGSSDNTVEMARAFGARVTSIQPELFNHGETRNLGVSQSSGRFSVMLVQDAIPLGRTWLEDLIRPFCDDRVAGVSGGQVPRSDSDPFGRWQLEYHNQFLGKGARIQDLQCSDDLRKLGFEERLRLFYFDNVCSAIRRDVWEQIPFRRLAFAEDLDWGVRAVRAGYRLTHDPGVQVIHSHSRPADYHLRRSYVSGRIVPRLLGMDPSYPEVSDDAGFLTFLGCLSGEALSVITSKVADWRSFSKTYCIDVRPWEAFLRAAGLRPPPADWKSSSARAHFYFMLEQLSGFTGTAEWNSIISKALAEAAGAYSASYYNWCESRGVVSAGMARLDRALSEGV